MKLLPLLPQNSFVRLRVFDGFEVVWRPPKALKIWGKNYDRFLRYLAKHMLFLRIGMWQCIKPLNGVRYVDEYSFTLCVVGVELPKNFGGGGAVLNLRHRTVESTTEIRCVHGDPSFVAPSILRKLLNNVKNLTIFEGYSLPPGSKFQIIKKSSGRFLC